MATQLQHDMSVVLKEYPNAVAVNYGQGFYIVSQENQPRKILSRTCQREKTAWASAVRRIDNAREEQEISDILAEFGGVDDNA